MRTGTLRSPIPLNDLGLPPLAGIASYLEACRPGISVEENTDLLRRYNYIKARLVEIFSAHITGTPEWELKAGFSLHLWLDAEHGTMIRRRVGEMREPPLHLDQVPDERLKVWLDEVLRARNSTELLAGIYRVVKGNLIQAFRSHLARTNPLVDHPTVRILRIILREEEEMEAWGEKALQALLVKTEIREMTCAWENHLAYFLKQAGGVSGKDPVVREDAAFVPRSDGQDYQMESVPKRDGRFQDVFNTTADCNEYQDESRPYDERMFALIYKRLREMGVPEYLSAVIYRTKKKPWEYYADLARQVWDEARHALMGQIGLYAHGMAFYEYPVNNHRAAALNQLEPLQVHALLWGTEQGLMPKKTGKQFEWKIAQGYGDPLCTIIQDYDWADEVLHAQIGRRWLHPEFDDREKLDDFCRQAQVRWNEEIDKLKHLSSHEPWWDRFVQDLRARKSQS
jgi:hypothetical protein